MNQVRLFITALLFVLLAASLFTLGWYASPTPFSGTTTAIARAVFKYNLLPFLGVGVLLLGAMIAAIYLAKKEVAA